MVNIKLHILVGSTFALVGSGSCCIFCPLLYMQFLGMRLVHRCLFTHFTKGDYDRCYDEWYIAHTPRKEEWKKRPMKLHFYQKIA
ncbi:hypothetical protein DVH24_020930 [Malus domestica]|uniref:Transmembrane protein n=1 Tax=Malus domestica TaxID=3750 RepID=A0A498JAV6_MALDO|nr:hypothetical protein DVH24_020930 [Malus domestica]